MAKIRLARKARVHFDRHTGKTMLLYPERGMLLNDSARAIVERCDGTRTVDEIIDELVTASGAAREVVERDVRAVLDDLRGRGLVDVAS
jgi:coenzyme PQQ biosynthesis protein PqqD